MLFRIFHKQSGIEAIREPREMIERAPAPFKEYARFPTLALPKPEPIGTPFGELLARRKSERDFDTARSIPLSALSTILHYSAGINEARTDTEPSYPRFRPSGGAKYPLECYLALYRIEGIPHGLYHYQPLRHELESLAAMQEPEEILGACEGLLTPPDQHPAAIIVITSIWGRNYPKYGEFAYRLALTEAGHMMQNMLLTATAHNVKAYPLAGFRQQEVASALDIDKEAEDPLYLVFLGN
jgi:SagB-type dehydrogenase family enzyme